MFKSLLQFVSYYSVMAQAEPNSWNGRVATVVKRACGDDFDDFQPESVHVIEVKDLLSTHLSSKSSAPGWL